MPANNKKDDSPAAATDLLAAHLHQLEIDDLYMLDTVLKETQWERTELVSDHSGTHYVRKYLKNKDGFGTAYVDLMNMACASFPKIYACYPVGDNLVIIMEYLEGDTLRQRVRDNGPLSPNEALAVVRQIADGLQQLHAMRPTPLIHRDVNPGNIIITTQGARLIDFGIARRFDAGAQRDTHVWGTQGYAPPEQFGFGQSDERTDVYALGMVLYFMITGHDPEPDVQRRVSLLVEDNPQGSSLYAVLARAIALDKTERYASVGDFIAALDSADAEPVRFVEADDTPAPAVVPQTKASNRFSPPVGQQPVVPAQNQKVSTGLWLRGKTLSGPVFTGWIIWQVVCAAIVCFFLCICLAITFEEAAQNPADFLPALLCYGSLAVFVVAPVCIVASNFCNLFGRLELFKRYRWLKALLLIVAGVVLLCLIIVVSYGMFSPEYIARHAAV